MLAKAKDLLWTAFGWLAAGALAVMWFLSRRRPNARAPVHIEPKKVPDAWEEVEKAARKEGVLK